MEEKRNLQAEIAQVRREKFDLDVEYRRQLGALETKENNLLDELE